MPLQPGPTHDPSARSWVESAQRPGTDFPIQNLPFGVFRRRGGPETPRIAVAIGDEVLDLAAAVGQGLLDGLDPELRTAVAGRALNPLMALGREAAAALRNTLFELLTDAGPGRRLAGPALLPMEGIELLRPVDVGDYTDFYASVFHATNVGSMFRPDNPLLPNYKYVPIGYHGRASSIVVSGTPVRRPMGQTKGDQAAAPEFGPSRALDYECEVGAWIGSGNPLGERIALSDAEAHLFGLCLLNDWSARDIQAWEYQPLGPFLAKSFASTISPWVVTADALAPFRVSAFERPAGDPNPLPYLAHEADRARGGVDLTVEVLLASERMRREGLAPFRVSSARFANMYWTVGQMITHHASNGCNLRPGDLLGSGTVSGPGRESRGCLLELTWRGAEPITLPTGEERRFLLDGDEVQIRGFCARAGAARIGLGECRGIILPAG
jgi:fumarylacetoacetase